MTAIITLVVSFAEIIFLICFIVYTISLIYSSLKGSPYVPTRTKFLKEILDGAKLKKGMKMLELGCGDGRLLIYAVKNYGVSGYGVDINPIVLRRAKWNAKGIDPSRIAFEKKNLKDINVKDYDVTYLFLLPQLLAKFAPKWEKEAKKNALFISHGFIISRWNKYLEKTLHGKPYDTFFYRIKAR